VEVEEVETVVDVIEEVVVVEVVDDTELVEVVELIVLDVTDDDEMVDVLELLLVDVLPTAGTRASVTTPKSLPCDAPNDSVEPESAPAATSYCAYTSWPDVAAWIIVNPAPADWSLYPVSPPSWKTKSGPFVETPMLQG
jgi:hypothetical protein